MPASDAIKYGILKTRDLVELYFGARMVVSITERLLDPTATSPAQVLKQDARRIRYEIIAANANGVNSTLLVIGTPAAFDAGNAQQYILAPNTTRVIERDWITDGEAVCLPLVWDPGANPTVTVRETFLTPAPVDEIP